VILSFENHCSIPQQVHDVCQCNGMVSVCDGACMRVLNMMIDSGMQQKMATYCLKYFKDQLCTKFLVENPDRLPSPEDLKVCPVM
jgi:hypothetical protein